jgi:hypothetical protein
VAVKTVYGRLADELGHSSARGRFSASPAGDYLREQNPVIPIDRDHNHRWVGEILFLARHAGSLWAVGEVDNSVTEVVNVRLGGRTVAVPTPLYFSASRIGGGDDGLALDSVALTASPASIAPRPVAFLQGGLDHRQAADRWRSRLDRVEHDLLTRAAHARADRQRGAAIVISEMDKPKLTRLGRSDFWIDESGEPVGRMRRQAVLPDEGRPPGVLRIRPCRIVSVR